MNATIANKLCRTLTTARMLEVSEYVIEELSYGDIIKVTPTINGKIVYECTDGSRLVTSDGIIFKEVDYDK